MKPYIFGRITLVLFLSACTSYVFSQNKKIDLDTFRIQDSLQIQELSTQVQELTLQIQEMKLNEITLQNEQLNKGKSDSIKKVLQKAQIDSLRLLTKGEALVVEGDTLFTLYARKGGVKPADRVHNAQEIILNLGKRIVLKPDSIYAFESEIFTDIMAGDKVILSITDQDALWQNTTQEELANLYVGIISKKIEELHAQYGLQRKITNILLAIGVIAGLILTIFLTNKLFKYLNIHARRLARARLKAISIKDYEFLNINRQETILAGLVNGFKYILIVFELIIFLSMLFSIFPNTESYAYLLLSYLWNPTKEYGLSFVNFIPSLLKIGLICLIFRYILKGVRYVATEISKGSLKINGFYSDWAFPTYTILRFLLLSFMIVMIWPLLPNSNSPIFQGVSVFLGLIVSLGSTAVIGNLMAGFVITYMRPFRVGDQIKLNEIVGKVIEKSPFVIRIETPKKEIVTIPNSFALSSHTINYSMSAENTGVIIYSDVTVGYEVPRTEVEKLLVDAAIKTKGVLQKPRPFVLVKTLSDFYCCYQINAYTKEDQALAKMYSVLHESIIDTFNDAGIEIMSPHFYAQRDGNEVMMPKKDKDKEEKNNSKR